MSGHRRPRRLGIFALSILAVTGLLAGACSKVASPEGWASPVVENGLILAAHRDELFALDSASFNPGESGWVFPSGGEDEDIDVVALYGTPALTADAVFVPTYEGTLYALVRETGKVLWSEPTDGPLIGGVRASSNGETIYFGSSDGKVYALDAATGEQRWEPFEADDGVWSTPTLSGDLLYVTSLDGRLYALDTATGEERWSFETGAGIASPAVVDDTSGLVFVGGLDGRLRAIDLETHTERWSLKSHNWFWTQPLVSGGVVYAGSLDGSIYAIDGDSGEQRWEAVSTEGPVRSAPLIVGGTLIVVDRDGNVYGLDLSSGDLVTNEPLALDSEVFADPVVVAGSDGGGDAVVVVTAGGELVRIDPATVQVIGEPRKLKN